MNIADELRKLQDLHQSGSLTDEEFAAAKARVLAGSAGTESETGQAMHEQLAEIKLQNEVARLDREWELERERYMVTGRYGGRYVPNRGMSALGGVVVVVFGVFWTAMAASISGHFEGVFGLFPLFGVLFIAAGIGVSVYAYTRANQYEQAYQAYQRRRARLLSGEPAPPDSPDQTHSTL